MKFLDDCAMRSKEKVKPLYRTVSCDFKFISVNYLIHIYLIISKKSMGEDVVDDV